MTMNVKTLFAATAASLVFSALAATVAGELLATGDEAALVPYDGAALRARFRTRLLIRRVLAAVRSPAAAELACAALRLPPLRAAARQVFFGRGSFPDVAPSRPKPPISEKVMKTWLRVP